MALLVNVSKDVGTQGVFRIPLGMSTLGWISRDGEQLPIIVDPPALPPPQFLPGSSCILSDPLSTATEGLLDQNMGIATLGWIVCLPTDSDVTIPPQTTLLDAPTSEWWYRKDDTDPWFGPLSYRDANYQARRMTLEVDNTINEVKYAQLGTILGTRGGDPQVDPNMKVVYMYANGRQYLGGRMAAYNQDKVPVL